MKEGKEVQLRLGERSLAPDGDAGSHRRWRNPRKPAKTIVHVNTHKIKDNQKRKQKEPVITVKKGNSNVYGYEVEIPGGCRVVYRPESRCAKVWIESLYDVRVISDF
ncbi:MAG: hypothetical protein AB4372_28495 [Xenococcus sp. (in: cyanobacteria)]